MPAVRSRIALVCVASAITAGLSFGGGTALAAADPAPGTQACVDAVENNSAVITARSDLRTAQGQLNDLERADGTSDATINAARARVNQLEARRDNVLRSVTESVCTGTATTSPTRPVDPPVDNGDATFDRVRALIANIDCADNIDAERDRIADLRTEAGNGLSSAQQTRLTELLNERLAQLDCQPAAPAPAPTTVTQQPTRPNVVGGADVDNNVTVNPTQDDGSVANTDGSQVSVVPEGSASTGAA